MDRRVVLTGLAATVVAAPALAQTSASSPNTSRAGAQMSQADMQHMQQTMQLGAVALETSRIALQKASNEDLKKFANFEVQEQTTLAEILRGMMDPATTAATGAATGQTSAAPAAGASAAMPMDANGRDMIQKLQSQQAGASFDRAYFEGQLLGHRDLLQVQERYLQSNPQNREHVNVAKMARGQIREHIALLEDIQQKIR